MPLTVTHILSPAEEKAVVTLAVELSTEEVPVTPQAYADARVREVFASYVVADIQDEVKQVGDLYATLTEEEREKVKAAFPPDKQPDTPIDGSIEAADTHEK